MTKYDIRMYIGKILMQAQDSNIIVGAFKFLEKRGIELKDVMEAHGDNKNIALDMLGYFFDGSSHSIDSHELYINSIANYITIEKIKERYKDKDGFKI